MLIKVSTRVSAVRYPTERTLIAFTVPLLANFDRPTVSINTKIPEHSRHIVFSKKIGLRKTREYFGLSL